MDRCVSETPTIASTILWKRILSLRIEALMVLSTHLNSALSVVFASGSSRPWRADLGFLVQQEVASPPRRQSGRAGAVGQGEGLLRAPPVLLERLLPAEDVDAGRARRGSGVVRVEKMLHEHQRMSPPRCCSVSASTPVWMVMCSEPMILTPARAAPDQLSAGEAGHLVLGEVVLLAAEVGKRHVGDLGVARGLDRLGGRLERVERGDTREHLALEQLERGAAAGRDEGHLVLHVELGRRGRGRRR